MEPPATGDVTPTLPLMEPEVTFWLVQESVMSSPGCIEVEEAERVHEGPCTDTVIVSVSVAVPPGPVQDTEYVVVLEGVTMTEPDVAPPVEKPVPVHEVALVELHESDDKSPEIIAPGAAVRLTVGAFEGGGVDAIVTRAPQKAISPCALVTVPVKVVAVVIAGLVVEPPEIGVTAQSPWSRENETAFAVLQESVVVLPELTTLGEALSVHDGAPGGGGGGETKTDCPQKTVSPFVPRTVSL